MWNIVSCLELLPSVKDWSTKPCRHVSALLVVKHCFLAYSIIDLLRSQKYAPSMPPTVQYWQTKTLHHAPLRQHPFSQGPEELSAAHTLIRPILNQQSLRPQPQARLAILANQIQRRHNDAATALATMISALLDHSAHALVHLVIQDRQRSLALLKLVLVLNTKNVTNERGDRVPAEPEELRLTVVDEVEAVRDEVLAVQVEGWRHGDSAGLRVRETSVVGHVVQAVKARIDVLNQQG